MYKGRVSCPRSSCGIDEVWKSQWDAVSLLWQVGSDMLYLESKDRTWSVGVILVVVLMEFLVERDVVDLKLISTGWNAEREEVAKRLWMSC